MDKRKAYVVLQDDSGIKVGDVVTVLRKAKKYECGWNTGWVDSMNWLVGKTAKVRGFDGDRGVVLEDGFCYPWFVLEVVVPFVAHTIKIDDVEIEISEESYNSLKSSLNT